MAVHVWRQVGGHMYDFYEMYYRGNRRGIRVLINQVPVNNSMCYILGHNYNPHRLDVNWYLHNADVFYLELGTSIAQRMERIVVNWRNPRWINATHARINGHGYHAIREDLY